MSGAGPLLGGVELGGTKCVCLIGTGPADIRAQESISTGHDPQAALARIEDIFRGWRAVHGPIAALGIASFGPLDLARHSPHFGFITSTAKPGWGNTDVAGRLSRSLNVSVSFDTDVNGAALAEGRWGAARGLADFAYVTVGTGIGAGLIVGGRTVYGFGHTELGHIRIARKPGDTWPGACAFHGDCLEGLASGRAIEARAGLPGNRIPPESSVWELVAHALAQLLHTLMLATAPRRILIGGGVVESRPELLRRIRELTAQSLNGYLRLEQLIGSLDDYALPPGLGALAGPLGALALATDKHAEKDAG
jgi:fructokinase